VWEHNDGCGFSHGMTTASIVHMSTRCMLGRGADEDIWMIVSHRLFDSISVAEIVICATSYVQVRCEVLVPDVCTQQTLGFSRCLVPHIDKVDLIVPLNR
jgi:hypothetical protein